MMKMSFRWYGEAHDPIPLEYIRQIPQIHGIVGALYDVPVGEIWPKAKIEVLKQSINQAGLAFEVVESVNVHEAIKIGSSNRDELIENYIQTLKNLSAYGIKVVTYNFMPIFDWTRTDLAKKLSDGSEVLSYDEKSIETLSPGEMIEKIRKNSSFEMPGWERERLSEIKQIFEKYTEIDEEKLRNNLSYFLKAIVPEAEKLGIVMAIHPDDPPWSIFGLPRIVKNISDLRRIMQVINSPSNGIALCTGSLGADRNNDIVDMIKEFSKQKRIPFAHVRNVKHELGRNFSEASHLSTDGSLDVFKILKAFYDTGFDGYLRPDHGRMIWGEKGRAGYGLYDRALGIAYMNGILESLEKMKG